MPEGGGRTEQILSATLPIVPILAPLGIHFLLVNFTLLVSWLPTSYFFSHLVVFMIGIWCAHQVKSLIAVICLIVAVVVTVLMDIIAFGLYFGPNSNRDSTWQFSAAMSIINLILKPLTLALASLALYVRAGGRIGPYGGGGGGGGGGNGEGYNDIHGSNEGQ